MESQEQSALVIYLKAFYEFSFTCSRQKLKFSLLELQQLLLVYFILFYFIFLEAKSCYVAQAGLELLAFQQFSCLSLRAAVITGTRHCAWLCLCFLSLKGFLCLKSQVQKRWLSDQARNPEYTMPCADLLQMIHATKEAASPQLLGPQR